MDIWVCFLLVWDCS
jgi:hypothetical protein